MIPPLDAILAGIIAEPADDLARLAYADALEELNQGAALRDLIRLQVRLARLPDCQTCGNRGRTSQTLLGVTQGDPCPSCSRCEWFQEENHLLGELRHRFAFSHNWWIKSPRHTNPFTSVQPVNSVVVDRGFVEGVCCSTEAFFEHGKAICQANPVTRVRLISNEPLRVPLPGGRVFYHWHHARDGKDIFLQHHIPECIWVAAQSAKLYPAHHHDSIDLAHAALSRWCIAWAREKD